MSRRGRENYWNKTESTCFSDNCCSDQHGFSVVDNSPYSELGHTGRISLFCGTYLAFFPILIETFQIPSVRFQILSSRTFELRFKLERNHDAYNFEWVSFNSEFAWYSKLFSFSIYTRRKFLMTKSRALICFGIIFTVKLWLCLFSKFQSLQTGGGNVN